MEQKEAFAGGFIYQHLLHKAEKQSLPWAVIKTWKSKLFKNFSGITLLSFKDKGFDYLNFSTLVIFWMVSYLIF